MKKLFSTKGRINRSTYSIFFVSYMVIGLIVGIMGQNILVVENLKSILLFILFASPFIYVGHCMTVQRLHDLDRPASDVWQLNRSWTLQYRLFLEEGTYGKNQYGYPQNPPRNKAI